MDILNNRAEEQPELTELVSRIESKVLIDVIIPLIPEVPSLLRFKWDLMYRQLYYHYFEDDAENSLVSF